MLRVIPARSERDKNIELSSGDPELKWIRSENCLST